MTYYGIFEVDSVSFYEPHGREAFEGVVYDLKAANKIFGTIEVVEETWGFYTNITTYRLSEKGGDYEVKERSMVGDKRLTKSDLIPYFKDEIKQAVKEYEEMGGVLYSE